MFARDPARTLHHAATRASIIALALCLGASCQSLMPLDTKPLDNAGMRYDSIKELKALHITAPEVAEIAKVRNTGLSDSDLRRAPPNLPQPP